MKDLNLYLLLGIMLYFILRKCSKNRSGFGKKNKFSASSESYSLNEDGSVDENIPNDAVIIFYAPWCGHCKKSMGEFRKAQSMGRGKVILVNSDENADIVKQYGVKGFPTIMKGDRTPYTGSRDASNIIDFLNE